MKNLIKKYIFQTLIFVIIFIGLPFLFACITGAINNNMNIISHLKWWDFIISFIVGIVFFIVISSWKENKKISSIRSIFWTKVIDLFKNND